MTLPPAGLSIGNALPILSLFSLNARHLSPGDVIKGYFYTVRLAVGKVKFYSCHSLALSKSFISLDNSLRSCKMGVVTVLLDPFPRPLKSANDKRVRRSSECHIL